MSDLLNFTVATIEGFSTKSARQSGNGFRLPCPAHGGTKHSLFIGDGDNRLIMICHSHHCDPKDIMESAGLTIGDIFYEKLNPNKSKEYKDKVTTRKLIEELNHELIIITLWITAFSEGVYPSNGESDRATCKQAFRRVQKALKYLEALL